MKRPVGAIEVVIEPRLDGRADGDLRAGEEPLHRVRHDVRRRVADHVERLRLRRTNRHELLTGVDRSMEVYEP